MAHFFPKKYLAMKLFFTLSEQTFIVLHTLHYTTSLQHSQLKLNFKVLCCGTIMLWSSIPSKANTMLSAVEGIEVVEGIL